MRRLPIRKKLVIVFASLAVVIVLTCLALWLEHKPTGASRSFAPAPVAIVAPEPVTISNAYFTAILPAGFNLKRQVETPASPTTKLQLLAFTSTALDQQVAVTIGTLPADGLAGVGDYNLRATQAHLYMPAALPGLPAGSVAFEALSGPAAFTVFWLHGPQYVELSMSSEGGASLTQLQASFATILAHWSWR